jgi:hypothetical protein
VNDLVRKIHKNNEKNNEMVYGKWEWMGLLTGKILHIEVISA